MTDLQEIQKYPFDSSLVMLILSTKVVRLSRALSMAASSLAASAVTLLERSRVGTIVGLLRLVLFLLFVCFNKCFEFVAVIGGIKMITMRSAMINAMTGFHFFNKVRYFERVSIDGILNASLAIFVLSRWFLFLLLFWCFWYLFVGP